MEKYMAYEPETTTSAPNAFWGVAPKIRPVESHHEFGGLVLYGNYPIDNGDVLINRYSL